MIVRDTEAQGKNVARCIRSAAALVDRALIIDTGSVDNTEQALRSACKELGLPLRLKHSDWVGHAHNRSELLKAAREESGADYCLMLDADMELTGVRPGPEPIRERFVPLADAGLPDLDQDEYMLPVIDRGLTYPLPLLTSTARPFRYEGVAHAFLACDDVSEENPLRGLVLEQVALIDHGGGGATPGKIERDLELLKEAVAKNPADARSWFYLAQSFRDLDMVQEAVHAYKFRASLGGWSEEVYQALYQAGALLCEHVSYFQGAKLLIAAAEMKPNRVEALRALAGCSTSVANKIPLPRTEVLFVEHAQYTAPAPIQEATVAAGVPPVPPLEPTKRKRLVVPVGVGDVTAIIVTRGNVDLAPILATLPYDDIIVWDNSKREVDYKIFGRYAAIPEALNPVIYWQDDDILFTRHAELMAAFDGEHVVANMDEPWVKGAGYDDLLVLMGAGSLCPAHLPAEIFARYLAHHPFDDDLLVEADFAFGTLAPRKRVDLGYEARAFSDDKDRLYQQEGQTARKWEMIRRCRAILET